MPLVDLQQSFEAGAAARDRRLRAADMLDVEQVAGRIGATPAQVERMVDRGRVIGLRDGLLGTRLPAWQFEPQIRHFIDRLGRELGAKEGWAMLLFLETPLGGLEGRTPRAAMEQGEGERVLALARHHI